MRRDLVPRGRKTPARSQTVPLVVPELVARGGNRATRRFLEFFTANIRNPNTRLAYARAVSRFLAWCEEHGLHQLEAIEPMVVAAYIEQHPGSPPTVKQHLAAIRMLFDWLVIGQVIPANPASSVRGPKHVVKRGKTPVLTADEARQLLDSIDIRSIVGLRDRALIGVMVYSFARVGAVTAMNVDDYYSEGKRWWFRLHEKGGKRHEVPAHHNAEAYMDAYLEAAGIADEKKEPSLPERGSPQAAHRPAHDANRRSPDDQAPGESRGPPLHHLLPHLPGHRHHRLPRERRHHRECSGHRRAREPAHDEALRPHQRRAHARRDRADRDLASHPIQEEWRLNRIGATALIGLALILLAGIALLGRTPSVGPSSSPTSETKVGPTPQPLPTQPRVEDDVEPVKEPNGANFRPRSDWAASFYRAASNPGPYREGVSPTTRPLDDSDPGIAVRASDLSANRWPVRAPGFAPR